MGSRTKARAGALAPVHPDFRPLARSSSWGALIGQALVFAAVAALFFLIFHITQANLSARGIHSGFEFLSTPAVTPIHSSPLSFEPGVDTYGKAFAAGALNSLKITVISILGASVLGLIVGIARVSQHPVARSLSKAYIEVMRNVPVLLHIIFWYGLILSLPPISTLQSESLVLASNRGVFLPWFEGDPNFVWMLYALGLFLAGRWLIRKTCHETVIRLRLVQTLWIVSFCLVLWPWIADGSWPSIEVPKREGFRVVGGIAITPEFAALTIGISLYTAAFIGEIVRSAIDSVDRGQWEAAAALALTPVTTYRDVVRPQALRVALPPLSSEYMGIFKNSTLAVAVGYQDFMAVGETMLSDTGQAIEIMAIVVMFYAAVSLVVSIMMHTAERRYRTWVRA